MKIWTNVVEMMNLKSKRAQKKTTYTWMDQQRMCKERSLLNEEDKSKWAIELWNEEKTCDWKKRGTLTFATTLSIPMNNDRLGKYAKVG